MRRGEPMCSPSLTECYAGPDYRYIHVVYSPADIDESPFI